MTHKKGYSNATFAPNRSRKRAADVELDDQEWDEGPEDSGDAAGESTEEDPDGS